jgi:hypothetical protein
MVVHKMAVTKDWTRVFFKKESDIILAKTK